VLGIYIYIYIKKKFTVILGLEKPGCYIAAPAGFEIISPRMDWQASYICWPSGTSPDCSFWESSLLAEYFSHLENCDEEYH